MVEMILLLTLELVPLPETTPVPPVLTVCHDPESPYVTVTPLNSNCDLYDISWGREMPATSRKARWHLAHGDTLGECDHEIRPVCYRP